MACSPSITIKGMESAAIDKGISLIGTSDFLHNEWLSELKANLESDGDTRLFKVKGSNTNVRFVLGGEVSTIFQGNDKLTKKIHHVIMLPDFESVDALRDVLKRYGSLESDGRPQLSMSAAHLVEEVFKVSQDAFVFPAHAWTPYFGVFGSLSGFDSMKDAYEDQEKHIFALETGLSCYDIETEVLTENGWKKFIGLDYSDKICSLNTESDEVEFQNPIKIWKSRYKGRMYRLKTKRVDLLVTPNHKLFYTPFAPHRKEKIFYLKEAELLFGKSKRLKKDGLWIGKDAKYFRLPAVNAKHGSQYYSGFRNIRERLLPIKPWLKFLGFWIAEGHTTSGKDGDYNVVVSNMDKAILKEMKEALEEMGFNPLILLSSACPQLRVRNFQLFDYLSKLGKSYQKYIPKEIKALSTDLLAIVFEYYIKGDGHRYGRSGKGLSATTNSVRLRDDLQELALKLGISAYYKPGSKKGTPLVSLNKAQYKSTHDAWVIYFIRRNLHSIIPSQIKKYGVEEWVDFDGFVYCVTVPNHVIYIRRNGIPIWCGNSDPAMNWMVSSLDKYTLLSNSDMHSLPKLGREANMFEIDEKDFTYRKIMDAIKNKDSNRVKSTIEFYPEEGKYHFDGHKECKFSVDPTNSNMTVCRVCGKKLVIGVLHRIKDLADRPVGFRPDNAIPYTNIVPLIEVIAYTMRKNTFSPAVEAQYRKLIESVGKEFDVLMSADLERIAENSTKDIVQAIDNVRRNKVTIIPGYAGVFGEIDLLNRRKKPDDSEIRQKSLF